MDRAAQDCGNRPCWKASKAGYKYKNRDKNSDGIKRITAKAAAAGKGKLAVEAEILSNVVDGTNGRSVGGFSLARKPVHSLVVSVIGSP